MSKPSKRTPQVAELVAATRQLLEHAGENPALKPSLQRVHAALEPFNPPARREVTLNAEQELYVIPDSHGYSCLGFDVLLTRYNAIAAWLRKEGLQQDDLPPEARGSMRAYTAYRTILDRAGSYCQREQSALPCRVDAATDWPRGQARGSG